MPAKSIRVAAVEAVPLQDRGALATRVDALKALSDEITLHAVAHPLLRAAGLAVGARLGAVADALRAALEDGASDADLFGLVLIANSAEASANQVLSRTDWRDLEPLATGQSVSLALGETVQQ